MISGVSLSTTTGAAATAGTHTIIASGGTAANYAITDVNGTLTVPGGADGHRQPPVEDLRHRADPGHLGVHDQRTGLQRHRDQRDPDKHRCRGDGGGRDLSDRAQRPMGGGLTNYSIAYVNGTLTVSLSPTTSGSIYVLDPTAGGALTLSGNASINIAGNVVVDSNSTSAILASGNAKVTAARSRWWVASARVEMRASPRPARPAQPATRSLRCRCRALPHSRIMVRERQRQYRRDDRAWDLHPDHRLGQRQVDPDRRHLHHPGGWIHGLGQRGPQLRRSHLHHRGGRPLRLRQRGPQRDGTDDLQRWHQLQPRYGNGRRQLRRRSPSAAMAPSA